MKKNSKNSLKKDELIKKFESVFTKPPSSNQKAWGIINDFYHMVLSNMEKKNISRADLARKIGKTRSYVTQMLNKTPNLTVRKMVEIADAVDLDLILTSNQVPLHEESVFTIFIEYKTPQKKITYPKDREITEMLKDFYTEFYKKPEWIKSDKIIEST